MVRATRTIAITPFEPCSTIGSFFFEIWRMIRIKKDINTAVKIGRKEAVPTSLKDYWITNRVPKKPAKQAKTIWGPTLSA